MGRAEDQGPLHSELSHLKQSRGRREDEISGEAVASEAGEHGVLEAKGRVFQGRKGSGRKMMLEPQLLLYQRINFK